MNRNEIENKIKGAFVGFAIGDAMGATTEFMIASEIKKKYGEVNDIIGGGWLRLKAGEVTDDTQMMLCVANAIIDSNGNFSEFEKKCRENFVSWYNTNPVDIGNQCRKVISMFAFSKPKSIYDWYEVAKDDNALGNGGLMRALPAVFFDEDFVICQSALTHNNNLCSLVANKYKSVVNRMFSNVCSVSKDTFKQKFKHTTPTGHVINTFNNAVYWFENTDSFRDCIIGCVNDGGDADTIAAISGSIAGAYYGFDNIPSEWVEKLNNKYLNDLLRVSNIICEMYLKRKGNKV